MNTGFYRYYSTLVLAKEVLYSIKCSLLPEHKVRQQVPLPFFFPKNDELQKFS